MNKFKKNGLLALFLFFSLMTTSQAKTMLLNVREMMQANQDFKINVLIFRLQSLQQDQVVAGKISEYYARCIAASTVHLLKKDAQPFVTALERQKKGTLSLLDQTELEDISMKYINVLSLAADSCDFYDKNKELRELKETQQPSTE